MIDKRIYLLFPASLRINLLSQQIRSLELVDALSDQDWMADVTSIAIVGGGASGVTAAAALRCAGLRDNLAITLFEGLDQLLPLQSGCHDKQLAPHIIDWPRDGAATEIARLPFLGWKTAVAGDVAIDLLAQFDRFDVKREVGATVGAIVAQGNSVTLEFEQGGVSHTRPFDLVIIAAGFGLEAQHDGIAHQTPPYWRVNIKQAPALVGAAPKRILISGLGDGGLIDFVLFACPGLSHARLCDQLISSPDIAPLIAEIEQIEAEIWQVASPIADIAGAYLGLNLDAAARTLILPWLVRDTEFALMTREPGLFHRGTSPLNRLAAALVIRAMELEDRSTRVLPLLSAKQLDDQGGESAWEIGGTVSTGTFDEVVIRHGDTSEKTWTFGNADIDATVANLRAKRRAIIDRPFMPILAADMLARFEARFFASLPTRIRLAKTDDQIVWHSDLAVEEVGRLWLVPSAVIHIEIAFEPLGDDAALDLAICRLLGHAEPVAQISGPHAAAWIGFMNTIRLKAGDKTRPAERRLGIVTIDRNEHKAEADQLAAAIQMALDKGLLSLLDHSIRKIHASPESCPIGLDPGIRTAAISRWDQWHAEAKALSSSHLRWVLNLFGGLLDAMGQADSWSAIRVGPKCLEELLPAILYHLAMQHLLEGFAGPARKPTGNVVRHDAAGAQVEAAHFCGSRWFRDADGKAVEIDVWEKNWPGEKFAPSCLVLPARTADFLPAVTMTKRDLSTDMVGSPWDRVPVIFGSPHIRQALRTDAATATSALQAVLASALPEIK